MMPHASRRKNLAAREIKAVYGCNKCPTILTFTTAAAVAVAVAVAAAVATTTSSSTISAETSPLCASLPHYPHAVSDLRRTLVILCISSLAGSRTYNLIVCPLTKGTFTTHSWLHLHQR